MQLGVYDICHMMGVKEGHPAVPPSRIYLLVSQKKLQRLSQDRVIAEAEQGQSLIRSQLGDVERRRL